MRDETPRERGSDREDAIATCAAGRVQSLPTATKTGVRSTEGPSSVQRSQWDASKIECNDEWQDVNKDQASPRTQPHGRDMSLTMSVQAPRASGYSCAPRLESQSMLWQGMHAAPQPDRTTSRVRRETNMHNANRNDPDNHSRFARRQMTPGNKENHSDDEVLLGLTEWICPQIIRPEEDDADFYLRKLGSSIGRTHSTSLILRKRRAASEISDGLHVETTPCMRVLSEQMLVERFGAVPMPLPEAAQWNESWCQPDPVRHVRVRPSHPGLIVDLKMSRPRASSRLIDAQSRVEGVDHSLQVSIGLVQFYDHPLFRQEHVLQRRLRSLAEQLGELHQQEALLISRYRVHDLRHRIEPFIGSPPPKLAKEAPWLRGVCVELLNARRQRDEHECAERLLGRRMLQLWQRLKRERRLQGFTATRANLQVQLLREDDHLESELEEELEERRLVHSLDDADGAVFDEASLREEIAQRHRHLRRLQGEEMLVPVYTEDTPPSNSALVPPAERRRQVEAGRVKLYPVLLVDNRIVGTSDASELHPFDFCTRMNYSHQLQLLQAPTTISLQLWQRRFSGLADFMLTEIFLAVPAAASPAAPSWQHYEFASDRTFKQHDGSSIMGDGNLVAVPVRCFCGRVAVSVAWAAQPAGLASRSSSAQTSFGSLKARGEAQMSSGALDTVRIRQHIRAEDLDPNAPQDVPLLSLLSQSGRSSRGGLFRANPFRRELQLVKEWVSTDRVRLLQLRREKPHGWNTLLRSTRAVPPRDVEIPLRMRELLQGSGGISSSNGAIKASRHQPALRSRAKHALAKRQIWNHSRPAMSAIKDVVKEPLLELEIEAFDLGFFLHKMFRPRRKLLPRPQRRAILLSSSEAERSLQVVVIDGIDLPQRAGTNAARTRLCVRCSFQGQDLETAVKQGANPIWNQRLQFALTFPTSDPSSGTLATRSNDVSINLFDRIEHRRRDDREQNVRTLREELRWLGNFTLPFVTLYRSSEVKGVFKLSMPPAILGYSKDKRSESKRLVPDSALQLFVTVDPLLPQPRAPTLLTGKDMRIYQHALRWTQGVRSLLPVWGKQRAHAVFAQSSAGEAVLLCRFIRPQLPPPREYWSDIFMEMEHDLLLLRYVSLIPFLDGTSMEETNGVWNTSNRFLELGAGGAEEHAVLLCNFFLAKGVESYVLIGHQVPQGKSAYVVTRHEGDVRLWDPYTGTLYSNESGNNSLLKCPLTAVGCLFNRSNIWANVQASDRASELAWNLTDPKCWRPFFSPRVFPQPRLPSVQAAALLYAKTTEEHRGELEREIEERLKKEFQDLRGKHLRTDWNASLGNTLKKLLKKFENDPQCTTETSQSNHDRELKNFIETYHIIGFPMNSTFTDMETLLVKVRQTNLWMSDSPKIEFALSAYVYSYPNNICSVWVYMAALHDKRFVPFQ